MTHRRHRRYSAMYFRNSILLSTGLDLTVSGDPVTTKTTPVALTHSAVRNFLKLLHNTQLRELGLELGLRWPRLKKMKEDCILDDMLDSWLREDDDVAVVSGHPSWQSLVKALEESGYTGVAAAIRQGTLCQDNTIARPVCAECTQSYSIEK